MVSASDFVDGTSIQWRRLGTVLFGAGIGAYFWGTISAFLALVDIPLSFMSGLTNFVGAFYGVLTGLPAVIIRSGFAAAVPYITSAGIAGFLLALLIALATLFISAWVVNRVR
ncbi:hypothetical protein [Haloarcula amylovorans]|uniref:hypothetical protein n=1 Tax=Haloarcula amylovorans TaxID=2562280 RepID=UPI001075E11F|nr:hypothetical protein [Halomicroarcula amylolytica]